MIKLTNTASPQESRGNAVTATIIFSYLILTSTLDVILLYLNNFAQNKHTKMYACE